jgi:hypothetical protein
MNRIANRMGRYLCCALAMIAGCYLARAQSAPTQDTITPLEITGATEGRFVVPQIPTLTEGEVNEIPIVIKVHRATAHDVRVFARYADPMGQSYKGEDDCVDLPVKQRSDGTAYIEFTPTHIGEVSISVGITFSDGLSEAEDTAGTVAFSDVSPTRIEAIGTEDHFSLIMGMPKSDPNARREDLFSLHPEAFFSGQAHPVPIPPADVHYNVISPSGKEPPITVDPKRGVVQSVHIGHALVRMSFEGANGYLCIDVRQSYRESSNPATCSDLVPRGESLPPVKLPNPSELKRAVPQSHPQ